MSTNYSAYGAKYFFDISKAGDGFKGSFLPYLTHENLVAFRVIDDVDGLHILTADTTADVPLADMPAVIELFVPIKYYNLIVGSDYAEDVNKLIDEFASLEEFTKFFTLLGSLILAVNAMISCGVFIDKKIASASPKIALIVSSLFNFWELYSKARDKMMDKLFHKADNKNTLLPSMEVTRNYMTELLRGNTNSFDEIRNRISISTLIAYQGLYVSLIGTTILMASLENFEISQIFYINSEESVRKFVSEVAMSDVDMQNKEDVLGEIEINPIKKRYFSSVVLFHILNQYASIYTGYDFVDDFASIFDKIGEVLHDALGANSDSRYIDLEMIRFGSKEMCSFEQLFGIYHPILEWEALDHIHLERDTTLPFALVSAFTLSLEGSDELKSQNFDYPLIKASEHVGLDNLYDEKEQFSNMFLRIAGEMKEVGYEIDSFKIFKLIYLATWIRESKFNWPQMIQFIENYVSALYLAWFRTGKFMRPSRNMNGFGGLEAYHTIHKEVLMTLGVYQDNIFVGFKTAERRKDSDMVYYYDSIATFLASQWIFKDSTEDNDSKYIKRFAGMMKNLVLSFDSPMDVARSLQEAKLIAAIAEICGLFDDQLLLRTLVNDYDINVPVRQKKTDLGIVNGVELPDQDPYKTLKLMIPGTNLETECMFGGGVSKTLGKSVLSPLAYTVFYVVSVIEKVLSLWSDRQTALIDSKLVFPYQDAKYLIVRSSYIEGGTLGAIEKQIDDLNPFSGR